MDYAATYCSIAEYYGIQCRIVRSNHQFCEEVNCDEEDATPGYDQLSYSFFIKPLLDKNKLPFTLESINSVAEDTWAHYWAEVLIDGEWEFMDASARDTANRYAQNDVVVVDWEEMDKSDEIVCISRKIRNTGTTEISSERRLSIMAMYQSPPKCASPNQKWCIR